MEQLSPRSVLRTAYESRYIDQIDLWMNMINDRNLMSHTYDFEQFHEILLTVQKSYLPLLLSLKDSFDRE